MFLSFVLVQICWPWLYHTRAHGYLWRVREFYWQPLNVSHHRCSQGVRGVKVNLPSNISLILMNKNAIRPEKCVPSLPQDFHNPFRNLEKNLMDPTPGFSNRVDLCHKPNPILNFIMWIYKWSKKFHILMRTKSDLSSYTYILSKKV